jgi:excisionase family DNA binding protein
MMEENKDLIPAKEAAQRLGVSRATLSRLVKRNSIGVFRVGARTMFNDAVLEDFKWSVFVEAETKGVTNQ